MSKHFTSKRWPLVVSMAVALAVSQGVQAQAPAVAGSAVAAPSAEELDSLVGPIALYPDDLVGIVLPASTVPLQIVEADRFLESRKKDPKLQPKAGWDEPVTALLNYPDVVKKMSDNLDWTVGLGEAVAADQGAVLEAIQRFRRRVQAAGNLKSDDKQVVVVEKEVIKVVQADPQVIYVPTYNPSTVVVASSAPVYGYYPTPYPVYYYPYPPGAMFATGVIFGAALASAWHPNYHDYHVSVDRNVNVNANINRNNTNINRNTVNRGQTTAWKPNRTPAQVGSGLGTTRPATRVGDRTAPPPSAARLDSGAASRVGDARSASSRAATTREAPSRTAAMPADRSRAAAQPVRNRDSGAKRDAFSGYESGRAASNSSQRGAASRNAAGLGERGGGRGGGERPGGGRAGGRGHR